MLGGGQAGTWLVVGYKRINEITHPLVHFEASYGTKVKESKTQMGGGLRRGKLSPFHKRKGLVVPVGCVPAWGCMLIRGCGMDMEAGIPALIPACAPTPPTAPTPIPGITWPMGAIPARGTMGCAGMEERATGSGMLPKLAGMGLIRIWLRVGGAGWLTWKGFAWAAGAEPPEYRQDHDTELSATR